MGGRSQGQTGLDFNSESGMPQYDFITKKVYVNRRRVNGIAEIDPAADTGFISVFQER